MHVPLSIVLASLALVAVAGGQATTGAVVLPAKIVYVDVGQGDAVVMRIGGKIVVSDTGQYDYDRLDRALRDGLGAKRIDVLILGHAHDDHSRNAAELLRKWEVGRVVMNESLWWGGTRSNKAVKAALRAEPDLKRTFAVAGETFDWGGAKWVFANPPRGAFLDASSRVAGDSSLAFLLTVNGVTALFTGDIPESVARNVAALLDPVVNDRVDIFLATHHGSKEGSIDEILDVIHPRWAVLSTGKNGYEHPSLEAIGRLKAASASIWCTAANGSVTARISATGVLTWRTSRQVAPWWSAKTKKKTGSCVGR